MQGRTSRERTPLASSRGVRLQEALQTVGSEPKPSKVGPRKVSKYTCTSSSSSLSNFKISQNVVNNESYM